MTLLARPKPFVDESLRGYLVRLAEVNGYESCRWIYTLAGLEKFYYTGSLHKEISPDLTKLAELIRTDVDNVLSLTFHNEFASKIIEVPLEVNTIHNFGFNARKARICPQCVKEKGYFRKSWEFGVYTACPRHGCLLIDKCPNCDSSLMGLFRFASVSRCQCGFELTNTIIKTVSTEDTKLAEVIDCCLNTSNPSISHIMSKSPSPLLKLDVFQVNYIILFFSFAISRCFYKKRLKFGSGFEIETIHDIVSRAYNIFSNWPFSFYQFLEQYRKVPKGKNFTGIKREFGFLYREIYEKFTNPTFEEIKQQFEHYLIDRWDGGKLRRFSETNSDTCFITAVDARVLLQTTTEKIVDLINKKEIEGVVRQQNSRVQILVSKKSLQIYVTRGKEYLTHKQAAEFLGVTVSMVHHLIKKDFLQAVPSGARKRNHLNIVKKSVIDLRYRLTKNIDYCADYSNEMCTFDEAVRYSTRSKIYLIQATLNGLIHSICIGEDDRVESLRFLQEELDRIKPVKVKRKKRRGKILKPNPDLFLSQKQTAKMLGVSAVAVSSWVKDNYFVTRFVYGKHYVTVASIKEFQMRYISLNQLCSMDHRNPSSLMNYLLGIGITAVNECDKLQHGEHYLFSRAEALDAIKGEKTAKYFTIRESSERLQVSVTSLRKWIQHNLLPTIKLYGRTLVTREDLLNFQSNYLWLSRISFQTKLKEPYILKELNRLGVEPICCEGTIITPNIYHRQHALRAIKQLKRYNS